MSDRPLYQILATVVAAYHNAKNTGNTEWVDKHATKAHALVEDYLPSGSGFDAGTQLDLDRSTAERLILTTSYHHMEDGYYAGWTEHEVIVTASLAEGFRLRVTGRNRNDIKDYIAEVFHESLSAVVDEVASPDLDTLKLTRLARVVEEKARALGTAPRGSDGRVRLISELRAARNEFDQYVTTLSAFALPR